MEGQRLLYTRQESARQLSLSVRSIDYLIGSKQLMARRMGKRVLVPHSELLRFARGDHPEDIRTQ
jgi:excisionase family DNA binding protein